MEDESAVSLETAIPLFSAAGMSVPPMSADGHASWMERAPHQRRRIVQQHDHRAFGGGEIVGR